uniref:Uncharacterized protein n=1 Tax=Anopheles arabiensis TaxID=7173 RepID=A0A182IHR2_ANOAR
FPSCCPLLKPAPNPKWSNRALRLLKSDKNRAQRAYRLNNTLHNLCVYKYAAKAYRLLNRHLYRRYVRRLQMRLTIDPGSFFRFVNSRRGSASLPSTLFLDLSSATSNPDICNLFAKHFSSV